MVAWPKSRATLLIVMAAGLAARPTLAADRTAPSLPESISPLQAGYQGMTGDELFARLLEHNQIREARLRQYRARRTYEVTNDKGKIYAQEVVRVDYQAPDHKSFHTESEEGSGLVRNMVLKRLIESESETSSGRAHHDSAIKPANYEFNLLGEQDVGPYHCLLVEATPKRKDKYLFEGKIWIDAEDYAIVRIAGQPAKSLSFWITRADFVRQYQKIGEFWLPAQDETFVRMRMAGRKILTIQHREYAVNEDTQQRVDVGAVQSSSGPDLTAENQAKETR
jgi:outer membrane lipoprotein-sorting protein